MSTPRHAALNVSASTIQEDFIPGDEQGLARAFIHADEFVPRLSAFCESPSERELNWLQGIVRVLTWVHEKCLPSQALWVSQVYS